MTLPDFLSSACTTPLSGACYVFLLLMIYSFLGWCGEMVYCSIGQRKLCEKRGFLNGPICPIYGHGALVVLLALNGGCSNPLLTFLLGAILTSAVEYFTSWAMEKLFHMRWWDYSHYKFQLGGRICLLNSTLFGLASVFLCHWCNPVLTTWVSRLFDAGAAIPLALVLAAVYLADIVVSVRSAIQIGSRLEKLHAIHDGLMEKLEQLKAEQREAVDVQRAKLEESIAAARHAAAERTAEAAQAVQARLEPLGELSGELVQKLDVFRAEAQQRATALYENQDIFERRLMRSYPSLRSLRHGEALKKLREYWEKRKK